MLFLFDPCVTHMPATCWSSLCSFKAASDGKDGAPQNPIEPHRAPQSLRELTPFQQNAAGCAMCSPKCEGAANDISLSAPCPLPPAPLCPPLFPGQPMRPEDPAPSRFPPAPLLAPDLETAINRDSWRDQRRSFKHRSWGVVAQGGDRGDSPTADGCEGGGDVGPAPSPAMGAA